VQHRIVTQRFGHPDPPEVVRLGGDAARDVSAFHVQIRGCAGQRFGRGNSGRRRDRRQVDRRFGPMEARDEIQHRALRLIRDDLAGRERTAVTHAVDLVEHGLVFVTGLHEVGVQRLGAQPIVDGEPGGAQCLRDDLPAIDATPPQYRTGAEVSVGLHLLE
jgi:hypothetical protein